MSTCAVNQQLRSMIPPLCHVAQAIIVKRELLKRLEQDLEDVQESVNNLERMYSDVLYYPLNCDYDEEEDDEEEDGDSNEEQEEQHQIVREEDRAADAQA
ncbi:hypothetical protein BD626DRAFT_576483 [Schizophyllum amplum]|uniref:Uncharacterized protein n=1 Tax=Schizophyllum amplum TaxID=97359 RepID=A0A550BTI8_9AGAR|nr:hypothetical protein BD626DRAFT_576483 [Auriculariopsis ampla]